MLAFLPEVSVAAMSVVCDLVDGAVSGFLAPAAVAAVKLLVLVGVLCARVPSDGWSRRAAGNRRRA